MVCWVLAVWISHMVFSIQMLLDLLKFFVPVFAIATFKVIFFKVLG